MALKVLVCLSLLVFVVAEDLPVNEEHQKVVEECSKENNVSQEEIHKFAKELKDATPAIKDFFLCVTKKLGTFDEINWNKEQIRKVVDDENKMKYVEDCLAKDDKSLEPRERNYAMVLCCFQKDAFM